MGVPHTHYTALLNPRSQCTMLDLKCTRAEEHLHPGVMQIMQIALCGILNAPLYRAYLRSVKTHLHFLVSRDTDSIWANPRN